MMCDSPMGDSPTEDQAAAEQLWEEQKRACEREPDSISSDIGYSTNTDENPCARGMKTGLIYLYPGKEDHKGRFLWQKNYPEDVGEPAENAETAGWALVVRKKRAYKDSKEVLNIESISVQSPLLMLLLARIFEGTTVFSANRLSVELGGTFVSLIQRWDKLKQAIAELGSDTQDQRRQKAHAELLMRCLTSEFEELIDDYQDQKSKRCIKYEHLCYLFEPGATMYSKGERYDQDAAMTLDGASYRQDDDSCFWVTSKFVAWDGVRFGTVAMTHSIAKYSGVQDITTLPVYPLEFHPASDAIRGQLIDRGAKAEALTGLNYKAYRGIGAILMDGKKVKYNVRGRIVIDTYGFNRFNLGNMSIDVVPFPFPQTEPIQAGNIFDKESKENSAEQSKENPAEQSKENPAEESKENPAEQSKENPAEESNEIPAEESNEIPAEESNEILGDMNDKMSVDSSYESSEWYSQFSGDDTPLTTEQKLICSPWLQGYSLEDKLWLNFVISGVEDIKWQDSAFDNLVLPNDQKKQILGVTIAQRESRNDFDDFIVGKGQGMAILLTGPPGVGKTLTAESVAEKMKVPLYRISAKDLSLDVETKLQEITETCTRWNAIILLDNVDVFPKDESNKLASTLLRVLEYFEGTMFLTMNSLQALDPLFRSRIHISIEYTSFTIETRKKVWLNILNFSSQKHNITENQLIQLADKDLDGRQIKNIIKMARQSTFGLTLTYRDITNTLEATQYLYNETLASKCPISALYG
ncbi:AAA family ATPase [Pyrenophora seminiperda CCB06]|uniref:AAA family ATPase n=1 Tax=Pyrenophora seminiperda CCB06 TaxID=1302712 RepID=A0A3M7M237_9PLEO|nr:AAA family ATPase [Pyrenophora seminiperda CCB06]